MATRKPRVTRLGRFVRGRRFDRNPLRRATDRIETAVLTVLVAAFLIGAPFAALAAGAWVHGLARQAQLTQEASRSQATAVVVAAASPASAGEGDYAWLAQARWRTPGGQEVIHRVPAPMGTVAGEKLQVWTDRDGDVTSAPLSDAQVAEQTTVAEVTVVVVAAGVLALVGALTLWVIKKRQLAAWDADWHVTGPRWTTRT
ncbi:MAG TPA: hypothetical protein VN714_12460 [Trebonia sp.]|jgi:hypothetical protein|nr:hypothetical protein [Trebonia sp.]